MARQYFIRTATTLAVAASLAGAAVSVAQAETIITNLHVAAPESVPMNPISVHPTDLGDTADVSSGQISDPLEPVNRVFFGVNEVIDLLILHPFNVVYRTVFPGPVRKGISNAVDNISSPVVFANDILQGEFKRAGTTLSRFVINSTVGVAGLVDVAAKNGLEKHYEDFGQTLGVWGFHSGPYLVLPVIGPSSLRDTAGIPVDSMMDPITWLLMDKPLAVQLAPTAIKTAVYYDLYADDLATLRQTSPDYYASVRDLYAQRRSSEVANGNVAIEPLPPIDGN